MLALSLGIPRAQADTVTMTSFTATSGNVGNSAYISYATYKGGGTSNPYLTNNTIRLYQPSTSGGTGGYITISAQSGVTIQSVVIGSAQATAIDYVIGAETTHSDNISIAAGDKASISNVNDNKISIYCKGATKNNRLEINYLEVTYKTEPQKPGAPIFRVNGKDVSGTLTLDIGKSETVNVVCDGATSLEFTSPENRTETNGADDIFTIPAEWGWIVSPNSTTITVAGKNDVGTGESSTLKVEFKAPVVTVDAPTFKLADGTPLSGSATVEAGTEITVGSATADATVTLSAEPAGSAVINGVTATVNKTCKLTAVAELSGKTATSTLDVTVRENTPGDFVLLTDPSQLQDGMDVIVVYDNIAVGAYSNNKYQPVKDLVLNADKTVVTDHKTAKVFTVEGDAVNGWYFRCDDGYMKATSSTSTNVSYVATKDPNCKITLKKGSGNPVSMTIQFSSFSSRSLVWRASTFNVFGNYGSSTGEYHPVSIYYKETGPAKPVFSVSPADATFETGSDGENYYTNPIDVTITSATEGATIHYSIDGGDEKEGLSPFKSS